MKRTKNQTRLIWAGISVGILLFGILIGTIADGTRTQQFAALGFIACYAAGLGGVVLYNYDDHCPTSVEVGPWRISLLVQGNEDLPSAQAAIIVGFALDVIRAKLDGRPMPTVSGPPAPQPVVPTPPPAPVAQVPAKAAPSPLSPSPLQPSPPAPSNGAATGGLRPQPAPVRDWCALCKDDGLETDASDTITAEGKQIRVCATHALLYSGSSKPVPV